MVHSVSMLTYAWDLELASSEKEQLQLVFEMLEGDFASWRRNGVPVRPEFAQASSFGW